MSESTRMNEKSRNIPFKLLANAVVWRWRLVLVAAIVTPLVAVVISRIHQPAHVSEARVLIQDREQVNPILRELGLNLTSTTNLSVIQTLLSSRQFAETMLRDLGAVPEDVDDETMDRAVADFQERLLVGELHGLIHIRYADEGPARAQEGLQLVTQGLIREVLRPHAQALTASVDFLADQLARMRTELEQDEIAIRTYREENAELLPEVHRVNLELYLSTHRQLLEGRSELAGLNEQSRILQDRLQSFTPETIATETRLGSARRRLASLSASYTPDHPRVIQAREEVARLERSAETRRTEEGLGVDEVERLYRIGQLPMHANGVHEDIVAFRRSREDIESLQQRLVVQESRFADLQGLLRSFVGSEQGLTELMREVEAKADVYRQLLEQYQDALVTRELTLQEHARQIWILDGPTLPAEDSRPGLKLVAAAGLGGGLLLAFLLIVLFELFDRTVRLPEEASEVAGVPTVAVMPPLNETRR
jgi:polysaccharide biosynthesis transport protein